MKVLILVAGSLARGRRFARHPCHPLCFCQSSGGKRQTAQSTLIAICHFHIFDSWRHHNSDRLASKYLFETVNVFGRGKYFILHLFALPPQSPGEGPAGARDWLQQCPGDGLLQSSGEGLIQGPGEGHPQDTREVALVDIR